MTVSGIVLFVLLTNPDLVIDGFGSYTDRFMRCHVFKGIGSIAQKYYMLFQHHIPPPRTTFTTDAPKQGEDPVQSKNVFVKELEQDPSFIIGRSDGPYVEQRSRSLYMQLGASIAFLGVDARTERTRHQINYEDTYEHIFSHVSQQLAATDGKIKHLILLLGVPIAYPRLQWLENVLQSPLIGPIKFLNKRFGVGGGLFNTFDGGVDLIDDLDDHYTSHHHKKERRELLQRLQKLSKQFSVRVTILGGDVHLAALGRFYSNPKLGIPVEHDWRFMTNIVSSAITNKPPPQAVANLLARRNKIHHLDTDTDETLLNLWDHDPGSKENPQLPKKSADANHCTMPSRNFALISESYAPTGATNGTAPGQEGAKVVKSDNPRDPMHAGEVKCGSEHPSASGLKRTGLCGASGLDITFRVEIDSKDTQGKAEGYGLSIPGLDVSAYKGQGEKW